MAEHMVRIKHDPESHTIEDCHDDCRAEVICLGVTDACRTWWDCEVCRKTREAMDGIERLDYDEALDESGEAHGEDHQHIDGMWMTPSNQCLSRAAEEDDSYLLIPHLPEGDHAVSIDYEEGYLYVAQIPAQTDPPTTRATDQEAGV